MVDESLMDTFITWYDEVQPGLPELHGSYDDWRNIHHCFHPAQEKWGFWWTHKKNVGVSHHCDGCDTDFALVDGNIYADETVDFRVPPGTRAILGDAATQKLARLR